MKKFLRQYRTGRWLTPSGELRDDFGSALEIKDFLQALSLCRTHQLTGMELVLKFPKEEYDLSLPLKDNPSSSDTSPALRANSAQREEAEMTPHV